MGIVLMLRDMDPAERSRKIDELTKRQMDIPYSQKGYLSRSTIYRWLHEYRISSDQSQSLLDKERSDRGEFRALNHDQKDALIAWRSENRYRTVANLRDELLAYPQLSDVRVPSESTIARFLQSVNLDRKTMGASEDPSKKRIRLPFEAEYPQQIWQIDTKGPKLEVIDQDTGELKIAKPVVIIDDCSRYILIASYVLEETEHVVMQLLRVVVSVYGIPETLYADRGGPYVGHSLSRAMTLIGCKILHTKPRDPSAKGKVEKAMPILSNHLESELMLLNRKYPLEEVNEYAQALISQDYQKKRHSVTGQTPEERYLSLPVQYRRFVSEATLNMVFLDSKKAHVSNTGIIKYNRQKYLVPDATLFGKDVVIRFDDTDSSQVHVWHNDRCWGEAKLHIPGNHYLERLELLNQFDKPKPTPSVKPAPPYNRISRLLAAHRREMEDMDLNTELAALEKEREEFRAQLTSSKVRSGTEKYELFGVEEFVHLLSVLLRRQMDAYEHLSAHTVWNSCGPFSEEMVRRIVGQLLGQNHPTTDLKGFLNALRIDALTTTKDKER